MVLYIDTVPSDTNCMGFRGLPVYHKNGIHAQIEQNLATIQQKCAQGEYPTDLVEKAYLTVMYEFAQQMGDGVLQAFNNLIGPIATEKLSQANLEARLNVARSLVGDIPVQ